MLKDGKPLEEIYEWEGNWEWLAEKVSDILPELDEEIPSEPKKLRGMLRGIVRDSINILIQ